MNYANLGRGLETLINHANLQYRQKGIATIQKISTPWVVIRSPSGRGSRITSAFPEGPSTVDYMGDYDGRSICFEAKQHKAETAFPLKNIEPHQVDFMRDWQGIKFFVIEWVHYREIYRVSWETIVNFWDQAEKTGARKSIPYSEMKHEKLIKANRYGIVLDYLEGVLH